MRIPNTVPSVLVIGASYGLLPAAKIAAAGMSVTVIGHPEEVAAINRDGVEVHFDPQRCLVPPMGASGLSAKTTEAVKPDDYDLVILAVQEPQARAPEIAALLEKLGVSHPIASIMNMPQAPFLSRNAALKSLIKPGVYSSSEVWAEMADSQMTLASPDPQAYRFDPDRPGALQVSLASNFKFAPFEDPEDQALLVQVCRRTSRVRAPWGKVPVNFVTKSSLFTPLAKWPMLVTGNCRCLNDDYLAPHSIREAVNKNTAESRSLYEAINAALRDIGTPSETLVPFDHYVAASQKLSRPSSMAMALARGAVAVERIDLLVLELLLHSPAQPQVIDVMTRVSNRISERLQANAQG